MRHLELFAGIGGFRRALDLIGSDLDIPMECIGYSEIEPKAVLTYQSNYHPAENEIVVGDIVAFTSDKKKIEALPDFDLLTGGFPCQTFSMMGKQAGFDEDRGQMFFRIADILRVKRPRYVLLENVKNLYTHDNRRTFAKIVEVLHELGYKVASDIFNTANFHLPQTRNRVLIFATNSDLFTEQQIQESFTAANVSDLYDANYRRLSPRCFRSTSSVLSKKVDPKYFLSEKLKPTILSNGSAGFVSNSEINLPIARPLTATMHKMHRACQDNYYSQEFIDSNGKVDDALGLSKEDQAKLPIRKLTPEEAFKLQGFPGQFATNGRKQGVSDGALYKQAGNAVSVNTIYAALYYLINNGFITL